ncbi:MAG: flavin reductase family protein [Actinomycetia bacterium]|nr:flavin reductase family protein [Actinomycetes bacterium]
MPDEAEATQGQKAPDIEAEELFRHAMGSFASGVTVVSCVANGMDHVMTASAVSSVSLDPPLILVCVNRSARFHAAISSAPTWAVSVLSAEAKLHAEWFATSGRQLAGQLDSVPHHRTPSGTAVLDQTLATLECKTQQQLRAGDHDIVIGRVTSVDRGSGTQPLLYWRTQYRELATGSQP